MKIFLKIFLGVFLILACNEKVENKNFSISKVKADTLNPCSINIEGREYLKVIFKDTTVQKMLLSSVSMNKQYVYYQSQLPLPELNFQKKEYIKNLPFSKYNLTPKDFKIELVDEPGDPKALILNLEKLNCTMGIFTFSVHALKGSAYTGIFYKAKGEWKIEILINVEV